MLMKAKALKGYALKSLDGDIGSANEFLFDDRFWAIRYLVADTGTWLSGRQVLLSPYSFGRLDRDGNVLSIKLTKKQIENSPSIESDRPVSRQYEANYYSYYGYPTYWEGGGLWGYGAYPEYTPIDRPYESRRYDYPVWEDIHLRSVNAVTGYAIQATDGALGSLTGVLVEEKKWLIREFTVETGHWYSGKEILITPADIDRISYPESKVFVNLTKGDLERTDAKHLATAGV